MTLHAWGKFKQEDGSFHLLEHHCADVASCFEVLVSDQVLRQRCCVAAGQDAICEVTLSRLAVIAFLHDLGKINTGFQFKVRNGHARNRWRGHVSEVFYLFNSTETCDAIVDAVGLREMGSSWGTSLESLLVASWSHHGRPATKQSESGKGDPKLWESISDYNPLDAARLLGDRMRRWFSKAFEEGPDLPNSPEFEHLFAGIVVLADQIGSNETIFKFVQEPDIHYIDTARTRSQEAVRSVGLDRAGRNSNAPEIEPHVIFDYERLRPAQDAILEVPTSSQLVVIESETGSGKTEAAILRFTQLWRRGVVDGLYFALPTRAAATQIHERVHKAVKKIFPNETWAKNTVLAVPGYFKAKAGENSGYYFTGKFSVCWEDNPDEEDLLSRWSAECSRKYLSSTVAVGTVDQVLLSGLQVKWAHLRGASASRSLLVIDEVHASDEYMIEILRNVLEFHLSVGGHALLMSATLGSTAQAHLLDAKPMSVHDAQEIPYPCIAHGSMSNSRGANVSRISIEQESRTKTVSIFSRAILESPKEIADLAISSAGAGACVLIIRNTVAKAQDLFTTILDRDAGKFLLSVNGIATLHHSRFAAEDRKRLDQAVVSALSKESVERNGCIIIGTQTLEQSLDIDADVLLTDLCPVDVLLQRIGRLHRHQRESRPIGTEVANCVVFAPNDDLASALQGSLLSFGLGESKRGQGVYRNLLGIKKTLELIDDNPIWEIPQMNRMLVELATHKEYLRSYAASLGDAWIAYEGKNWGTNLARSNAAKAHLLDRKCEFIEMGAFSDVDQEVRTRLGEDGPRIELADPVPGPFKQDVQTFSLPAYWFSKLVNKRDVVAEDVEIINTDENSAVIRFRVGDVLVHYDHRGIARLE